MIRLCFVVAPGRRAGLQPRGNERLLGDPVRGGMVCVVSGPSPQAVQRYWHDPAAGALALAAVVTVPLAVTRTGTGSLRSAAGREELASLQSDPAG
jgi:hypothetical protein